MAMPVASSGYVGAKVRKAAESRGAFSFPSLVTALQDVRPGAELCLLTTSCSTRSTTLSLLERKYHPLSSLTMPVLIRGPAMSFGMWGSYLPTIIRVSISPIWYGIGTYLGSLALLAMIEAIWPSFSTWHQDALPASANITAARLLCFAIFWSASILLMFVSMPALRWVVLTKIAIMPILAVCLFTWAVTASHGFGPLLSIPTKTHDGVSVGYASCYAITIAISGCATYAVWMLDIFSLASGNDLMGLFSGYVNLRRGQLLCVIVGFAVCPWGIEASATRFLAFAQVFTVPFLGPISGVLLCDYFVVRRHSGLNVYHLYKPHGIYWYHTGWNVRAVLALLVGMVPQLPVPNRKA